MLILYKGINGDFSKQGKNFLAADSKHVDYWTDSKEVALMYGPDVLEKRVNIPLDATIIDCKGKRKSCTETRAAILDSVRRLREGKDPSTPIVFLDIVDTPNGQQAQPHITVGFKKPDNIRIAKNMVENSQ